MAAVAEMGRTFREIMDASLRCTFCAAPPDTVIRRGGRLPILLCRADRSRLTAAGFDLGSSGESGSWLSVAEDRRQNAERYPWRDVDADPEQPLQW